MTLLESLLLGILQGLTEYLPISSSGHLTLGSHLLDITDPDTILPYTVLLHVATVLSTIVILHKEISWIFKGLFKRCDKKEGGMTSRLNNQQYYMLAILVNHILGTCNFHVPCKLAQPSPKCRAYLNFNICCTFVFSGSNHVRVFTKFVIHHTNK